MKNRLKELIEVPHNYMRERYIYIYTSEQYTSGVRRTPFRQPPSYQCKTSATRSLLVRVARTVQVILPSTETKKLAPESSQMVWIRVIGVLDGAVRTTGFLIGNRATYADMAFVTWAGVAEGLFRELGRWEEIEEQFERYNRWIETLREREAVRIILEKMKKGRVEHGFA